MRVAQKDSTGLTLNTVLCKLWLWSLYGNVWAEILGDRECSPELAMYKVYILPATLFEMAQLSLVNIIYLLIAFFHTYSCWKRQYLADSASQLQKRPRSRTDAGVKVLLSTSLKHSDEAHDVLVDGHGFGRPWHDSISPPAITSDVEPCRTLRLLLFLPVTKEHGRMRVGGECCFQ